MMPWFLNITDMTIFHYLIRQANSEIANDKDFIKVIYVKNCWRCLLFYLISNHMETLCSCFKWRCKRYFRLLVYGHKWHEYGFSPVWIRMCLLTSALNFWVLEQNEQAHNFSPTLIGTIWNNWKNLRIKQALENTR